MISNTHLEFFTDHIAALEQCQRDVLDAILQSFVVSDYARSINAADIATAEQYVAHVPVASYEDLRPWIERIEAYPNSLTADRTLAFFKTSGSTSKPKLIPVTPALMRQKVAAFAIFWGMIYRDYPQVATGTLVSNFIDASQPEPNQSGIEICSESSFWSRRGRSINTIQRWPLPAELRLVSDLDARLYAVARLLLQADLHCIMCLNPSTLLQFCRVLQTHSMELIRGLRTGTWGTDDIRLLTCLNVASKQSLESCLRTDEAAANRLSDAMNENAPPHLLDIWPMLNLVVCWRSTIVQPYFEQLAPFISDLPVRDYISQSSECMMAIPVEDSVSGGALAYTSHFYEFIEEAEIENQQASTRFAWQVEQGARYELVVTTGGGLYRYRTGDCVQVSGFVDTVPVIEFLYRFGKTSSITGEKLTEQHVLLAASDASIQTGFKPVEFLCYPSSGKDPHYSVMLDWPEGGNNELVSGAVALSWCQAFDHGLKQVNSEYADKCGSGRLGSMVAYRVAYGALRHARLAKKAQDVSDEQVKSEVLTSRLDCHKQINSAQIICVKPA